MADFRPFHILAVRVLDDDNVGIQATTAQGRRITTVVPFWNSTADGIEHALTESALAQVDADAVLLAVQESWAADERESDAVVDPDIDATTG